MKLRLSDEVKRQLQLIQTGAGNTDLTRFPDFLVAGPQRTASTALYYTLKRHPQIFLPEHKEVFYFSTLGQPDHDKFRYPLLEDYLKIMEDSPWSKVKKNFRALIEMRDFYSPDVIGEVTPSYAALESDVIKEIVAINPSIKVIITVRHPIERAISHATKDLVRTPKVNAADVADEAWEKFFSTSGQVKLAGYRTMIENWTSHLEEGHLHLVDFELVRIEPIRMLSTIHQFLGIRVHRKYCPNPTRRQKNANPDITLPDKVTAFLEDLLAEEVRDYEILLKELRAGKVFR